MNGDDTLAPVYPVPARRIAALEHPALLRSLDRGLATLGPNADFRAIVHPESPQTVVPLFLRPEDAASSGLFSHNVASHNVVLAVTVPKRTGRKRKRGSDGPWLDDAAVSAAAAASALPGDSLAQRHPRRLRQMLQDNPDKYSVRAVGVIRNSHRYRGLYDFQQSVHDSAFMTKFIDKVVPGELPKLREFELAPGVAPPPGVDIPPPPFFTTQSLPFAYAYSQNPFIREVATDDGTVRLVNMTASSQLGGYVLRFDHVPVPTAPPPSLPPIAGRRKAAILRQLELAMQERPIWTRRGLVNRLNAAVKYHLTENRLKAFFPRVGYQFKGGPWRDTLVRYGVDPRQSPEYRPYQTLLFKLHRPSDRQRASWHSVGGASGDGDADAAADLAIATPLLPHRGRQDTHIFDGLSYCDDGKIWQVCDITDPLIAAMMTAAPPRPTCDIASTGWYHQGTWAKVKALVKTKLLAIRFGRALDDASAFARALAVPDATPKLHVRAIKVPVPDLQLTPDEEAAISGKVYHGRPKTRLRKRGATVFSVPIVAHQPGGLVTEAAEAMREGGGEEERGREGEDGGEGEEEEEVGYGEDNGDEDEEDEEVDEEEEDEDDDEDDDDDDDDDDDGEDEDDDIDDEAEEEAIDDEAEEAIDDEAEEAIDDEAEEEKEGGESAGRNRQRAVKEEVLQDRQD